MKDSSRMYGLDALRGVAMTLGIVLHGTISYKKGYHYGEWVFDKQFNSFFFDWLYLWINSFRMQTFFLLAGFFACLLINKIGLNEFIWNRVKRIGLPFLISYFTILPLALAPYLLAVEFKGPDGWHQLGDFYLRFYTFRAHSGFMHLWFLQHLMVFYVLIVMIIKIKKQIGLRSNFVSSVRVGFKLNSISFVLITSVILGGLSQLFSAYLPSIWTGFVIPIPQFLYYLFFFALGWALENKRELFLSFAHNYKVFIIVGTVLNFVVLSSINSVTDNWFATSGWLKVLLAFQTMLLSMGFIGLFTKEFKKPHPFWRYFSDSAYWVYLIHLPIVLTTELLLLNSPVPGILRFPIVILVAIIISFGSYHLFVRYTWIGTLLNGKRVR